MPAYSSATSVASSFSPPSSPPPSLTTKIRRASSPFSTRAFIRKLSFSESDDEPETEYERDKTRETSLYTAKKQNVRSTFQRQKYDNYFDEHEESIEEEDEEEEDSEEEKTSTCDIAPRRVKCWRRFSEPLCGGSTPSEPGETRETMMMNKEYPRDLSPLDHPVLQGYFSGRPRSTSAHTPFTVRTFAAEFPSSQSAPALGASGATERRRSKRLNLQQANRYRTTPVTFEEIREIDEELYAKQQQQQQCKNEENTDMQISKRPSPFAYAPCKRYDFKCTYMTKTRLIPGKTLGLKPRSQESLVHAGVTHLPTIPEELLKQQKPVHADASSQQKSGQQPLENQPVETLVT